MPKPYDTTVARMAGNIAAGMVGDLLPVGVSRGTLTRASQLKTIRMTAIEMAMLIVEDLKALELQMEKERNP